ncbi:MAG: cyclic nucleotide-binding domain-containing protein [Pseudomonadota bacterium]
MRHVEKYNENSAKKAVHALLLRNDLVNGNSQIASDFINAGEFLELQKNEELITKGSEDRDVYFLIQGDVTIWNDGNPTEITRSAPRQVGEIAAARNCRRTVTVKVSTDYLDVLKISSDTFLKWFEKDLEFQNNVNREIADISLPWIASDRGRKNSWWPDGKVLAQIFLGVAICLIGIGLYPTIGILWSTILVMILLGSLALAGYLFTLKRTLILSFLGSTSMLVGLAGPQFLGAAAAKSEFFGGYIEFAQSAGWQGVAAASLAAIFSLIGYKVFDLH